MRKKIAFLCAVLFSLFFVSNGAASASDFKPDNPNPDNPFVLPTVHWNSINHANLILLDKSAAMEGVSFAVLRDAVAAELTSAVSFPDGTLIDIYAFNETYGRVLEGNAQFPGPVVLSSSNREQLKKAFLEATASPEENPYTGGGSALYDSIIAAINTLAKDTQDYNDAHPGERIGIKSIALFTGGIDNASKKVRRDIYPVGHKAFTPVSVTAFGNYPPAETAKIAEGTGGLFTPGIAVPAYSRPFSIWSREAHIFCDGFELESASLRTSSEKEMSFLIDISVWRFTVMLQYGGSETDIEVVLLAPDKSEHPMRASPNAGSMSFYANIDVRNDDSLRGDWTIVCKNKTKTPISCYLKVDASAGNGVSLINVIDNIFDNVLDASKDSVAHLSFFTRYGYYQHQLAHVDLRVTIEDPLGKVHRITAKDDGVHPDFKANDGVYEADFYCKYNGVYTIVSEVDNREGKAVTVPDIFDQDAVPVTGNFVRTTYTRLIVINAHEPHQVEAMTLSDEALYFKNAGETHRLDVVDFIPSDACNKDSVIWFSGDIGVATVDKNGLVTARGPGKTFVAALSNNGKAYARCLIYVGEVDYPYPPR